SPTDGLEFDPDEQARSVLHLLFKKFEELESGRALFRWLVRNGIDLPVRLRTGPHAGQLQWRRASSSAVLAILHHPMYAGAYAYGRRPMDPKRTHATGKWPVLIRDHLPAYLTWDQYLRNRERLRQNQSHRDTLGPTRNGCALLGGLVE